MSTEGKIIDGQCGNSVVGIMPGSILSCTLTWGHNGRHSDGQAHWDTMYELPQAQLEVKLDAAKAVLADRERELLDLKGPCSSKGCRLHYAHAGPCAGGAPKAAEA
jgi:hypothetical protein